MLCGIVEMDETYVGGKPRRGSGREIDVIRKKGRGTDKIPVVGMVQRGGSVCAKVCKKKDLRLKRLAMLVREKVNIKNSVLMTDDYRGYDGISRFMPHKSINHSIWYVQGNLHTNTIESFWALLKRGIIGQYHKVSLKHLPKYVDEFCYRYNHRGHEDVFGLTIQRAIGVA
jgi:transposase-like protein